jgi:membrane protease YdiL (CAAX protease family)
MKPQPSNKSLKRKSQTTYFVLVFLMSALFWVLGAVTEQSLPEETAVDLPISSLMGICPIVAGVILVYRQNGSDGVKSLLKRSFDYKRITRKIWYLLILSLMPMIVILVNGFMGRISIAFPGPQIPVLMVLVAVLLYFIEALAEEVGWQGYAFDPMQARWNALTASIILGIVWAAWHIIPFIQMHQPASWIVWQSINIVVTRIIIVWIYNNTGRSVFAIILYHTMYNVSTVLLPMFGLIYDPIITTIILSAIALVVIFLWGPKTLASYRFTKSKREVQTSHTPIEQA